MRSALPFDLTLALLLALAASMPALAQTGTDPAKPAKAPAAKPAPRPAAKPKPAPPPPVVVLPEATQEQKAAAERAYYGDYACEFNQTVRIDRHPKTEGYVNVAWNKQLFTMKPVLSSTGALRLEDVSGRTLMIQIANKSMLLDVKAGQRLVDECVSPEQRAAIERMKLEGDKPESSLGINPVKAAAGLAAASAAAPSSAASAPSAASSKATGN